MILIDQVVKTTGFRTKPHLEGRIEERSLLYSIIGICRVTTNVVEPHLMCTI